MRNKKGEFGLDWRLQAVAILSEPFRSPLTQAATIKFQKKYLSFDLPNITAIFLNMSIKLWKHANSLIPNWEHEREKENNVSFSNTELAFDCIESIAGSIVFSFCALESFANEFIPEDYIFKLERQDKKCVEHYNKEQIERFVNLDIKLGEVLPDILRVKTPKGKLVWGNYISHKKLRDRVIHLKLKDRRQTGPEDDTIWRQFFSKGIPNTPKFSKEMIDYFLKSIKEKPFWFNNYPYTH